MADPTASRSAHFALEFEKAQDGFIALVSSLTAEQWRMIGKNHPQRLNDEDERRPVGVIAHHVAQAEKFIIDRIYAMLEDKPIPPADIKASNAAHAARHAAATKEEVIKLLRDNREPIAEAVAAIPDESLDLMRVLIGHLKQHQGSIEATIA
jgi:DinB superfamily